MHQANVTNPDYISFLVASPLVSCTEADPVHPNTPRRPHTSLRSQRTFPPLRFTRNSPTTTRRVVANNRLYVAKTYLFQMGSVAVGKPPKEPLYLVPRPSNKLIQQGCKVTHAGSVVIEIA